MVQVIWQILRNGNDVTDQLQSFTMFNGRQTQFDSYSPGSLVLTIRNNAGQADNYNLNDTITLQQTNGDLLQPFWVQEVLYNDLPGAGAGSTATIVCTDLLGRMGRIQVFEQALPSEATILQLQNAFNSLMPIGTTIYGPDDGSSIAAADPAYTGTILNRLNLNMTTEQGWLSQMYDSVYLFPRNKFDLLESGYTFARETGGYTTQGAYNDIKRIALGPNYLNNCTVTPPVVAAQNATNAAGVAAYGDYGAEFSTVDNTAAQADGFADWQVNSRSDPDVLSFQISFSDASQDLTYILSLFGQILGLFDVEYKKPGDNTTYTSRQLVQGFSLSVTPATTFLEVFTSPLTFNEYFILNDSALGLLDSSRLGW